MPKNVQMPDGSVVAFPDSMPDDQIQQEGAKYIQSKQAQSGFFQGIPVPPPSPNRPESQGGAQGQASPQPNYPLQPISDILPAAGAGLGMLAGSGIASIPLAGLGGAAGSEISSGLKEKFPKLFGPGPDDPEKEAIIQGLLNGVAPEAGGQILGALAKGGIPAAQAMAAALKAGGKDVAVGTGKVATGVGATIAAEHIGGGGLGVATALGTRRLIGSGAKQTISGIKAGVESAKDTFGIKMAEKAASEIPGATGKVTIPITEAPIGDITPKGGFSAKVHSDVIENQNGAAGIPTLTKAIEKILTPARDPVTIPFEATKNDAIAKQLRIGDSRILPDGTTETLQDVPIDKMDYDTATDSKGKVIYNKIERPKIGAIAENGYSVQPRMNAPDQNGRYIINDGHHRVLADYVKGKDSVIAWVPAEGK